MAYPSKGDMIDLVNGLCLIQDRIQADVEQVPIGWRALKPRHLSISPSACAYYVRETSSTSTSWLKRNATTRMAKRLPSSRKCEDRMCKSAF